MNKIVILAALVLGFAMTHQAVACDWMHREAAQAQTASACDGSNCTPAPTAQQNATKPESAAATSVDEPVRSGATMVACQGANC